MRKTHLRLFGWLHPPDSWLCRHADLQAGPVVSPLIEKHVQACSRCRAALESYRALLQVEFTPPSWEINRILERERERLLANLGLARDAMPSSGKRSTPAAELVLGDRAAQTPAVRTSADVMEILLGSKAVVRDKARF